MSFGQNLAADRGAALASIVAAVRAALNPEGLPDMSLIYAEKERQAEACKAVPLVEIGPADFPLVRVDMDVDGHADMHAAADAIIDAADRMRAIARPLEEWRRTRKVAILAASSRTEVRAVDTSPASLMAAIAAALNA